MLCGLCLVGGFAACQKVDLPSEEGEDTEQPGQTAISRGMKAMNREGQTTGRRGSSAA